MRDWFQDCWNRIGKPIKDGVVDFVTGPLKQVDQMSKTLAAGCYGGTPAKRSLKRWEFAGQCALTLIMLLVGARVAKVLGPITAASERLPLAGRTAAAEVATESGSRALPRIAADSGSTSEASAVAQANRARSTVIQP